MELTGNRLNWQEIRKQGKAVNPQLHQSIDFLDIKNEFSFIRTTYSHETQSYFSRKIGNASFGSVLLLMLAKISDDVNHERIQSKYQIKMARPQKFSDHHKVFTAITNSKLSHCKGEHTVFYSRWVVGQEEKIHECLNKIRHLRKNQNSIIFNSM